MPISQVCVILLSGEAVTKTIAALVSRTPAPGDEAHSLAIELDRQFPGGDVGVLSVFFLNIVHMVSFVSCVCASGVHRRNRLSQTSTGVSYSKLSWESTADGLLLCSGPWTMPLPEGQHTACLCLGGYHGVHGLQRQRHPRWPHSQVQGC